MKTKDLLLIGALGVIGYFGWREYQRRKGSALPALPADWMDQISDQGILTGESAVDMAEEAGKPKGQPWVMDFSGIFGTGVEAVLNILDGTDNPKSLIFNDVSTQDVGRLWSEISSGSGEMYKKVEDNVLRLLVSSPAEQDAIIRKAIENNTNLQFEILRTAYEKASGKEFHRLILG